MELFYIPELIPGREETTFFLAAEGFARDRDAGGIMLNIQTRQEGNASVVTIQGKVNFEVTAQLRDVIRDTVTTLQPKLLVINLESVSFIDSSGLGLLVAARNSVDKNSGKLHLCGLPPQVKKTFDQTNLTNYVSIFTTEQDALRGA
jgi:anti-anti-sigma factor